MVAMNCILKNFWMIFWVVDVVRPVGAIIGWMRKAMRGEGTGRTTPFYNLSHELIVDETDEVWGVVHLCLLGGRCSGSQWTCIMGRVCEEFDEHENRRGKKSGQSHAKVSLRLVVHS